MKKVKCKYPVKWKLSSKLFTLWDGSELTIEGLTDVVVLTRAEVRKLYQKLSSLYAD